MFDLGFYEFIIIGFVLFLVLPSKDFPKTMRWIIKTIRKVKSEFNNFLAQFSNPIDEYNDIKKEIEKEVEEVKKQMKKK